MAWVMQCDRCKKIFEHKEGYRRLLLGYFRCTEECTEEWTRKTKGLDLCPECMGKIINFLDEVAV